MTILNNIYRCLCCKHEVIDEERKIHKCRKAKGFHIAGDIIWLSDGVTEYPLKLDKIKPRNQPSKNRDNNCRFGHRT